MIEQTYPRSMELLFVVREGNVIDILCFHISDFSHHHLLILQWHMQRTFRLQFVSTSLQEQVRECASL